MRHLLPLGCLVLALAGAAHGQTPRLRFLDLPPSSRPIMGRFMLRVSDDPFTRPDRSRTIVRLDGAMIAECYHLPCELAWETDGIEDGRHLLQLVVLDNRNDHTIERILDEQNITIHNGRAPTHADRTDSRRPEPEAAPAKRPETRSQPLIRPESAPVVKRQPAPDAHTEVRRPEAIGPVAQTSADTNLHNLNATAIALDGRKLCIGLRDGGITLVDTADRRATTIAGPPGAGEVRAVAAGSGTVWWLTAPAIGTATTKQAGPIAPAGVLVPQLCGYRLSDGSLDTFDVSAVGARFEPHQILIWGNRPVLVAGGQAVTLDPKTGEFADIDRLLPREIVRTRDDGAMLRFASDGSTFFVAAVGNQASAPDGGTSRTVRIWKSRGGDWYGGEARMVDAPAGTIAASLSAITLTLLTPQGITTVPVARANEPRFAPLPAGIPAVDAKTQAVAVGGDTWWLRGGTLFHADALHASADALFPWNVGGMQPRALAADSDGVWVATSCGVRRVTLDAPDSESGFGGFVRARLGEDTAEASGPAEQKLAAAIDSWQGTPYVWGGESRKGVDCSGFVMVAFRDAGVDLPHGSDNLRGCDMGQRVMDELRYGDVLVYPGHAAIYVGNGQTAETVSSGKRGVGHSTVWRRSSVVVRRFLNVALQPRTFASRGGKPPLPKPKKSSSASHKKHRS